jgi:1-pyrroline-5-carboxylate dehydrogenase
MGNTVRWKPSPLAMPSAWFLLQVFKQAGLPPGVINLVQDDAAQISALALSSPDLASVHLTGSTPVFQGIAAAIGQYTLRYRSIPRLARETGGKDFINDKPTGAVVSQQPFGGPRASGTNDKAGSRANLCRWTSPRTIMENFSPDYSFTYPFMEAE